MNCPCGNSQSYEKCCGPFISGQAQAPTAEALMRSRYSAYVNGSIPYIFDTYDPKKRSDFDEKGAVQWSKKADWQGLEILSTQAGKEDDQEGWVEFIARYKFDGEDQEHHELAEFRKDSKDDRWYFVDGAPPKTAPIVRDKPKVGRNDPCACGSGKKFKKCCA